MSEMTRIKENAGARLVAEIERLVERFVVLPAGVALVLSLYILQTYLLDGFDFCAYIAVVSPTKRCGKSTLAQVLERLCCRAITTVELSSAATFHLIDSCQPTLILDECEHLLADRRLRSLLNVGFRKGGVVLRCVGRDIARFGVFCAKVFCVIGELPATIRDRSILVSMRRAMPVETVEELRERTFNQEAAALAQQIGSWALSKREEITERYDNSVVDFLAAREADLWSPLFAIAEVATPERLGELKTIALRLVNEKARHDSEVSPAVRLLSDVRAIFSAGHVDQLPTDRLLAELRLVPESPWRNLTSSELANQLRPFEIRPRQMWMNARNIRGYLRRDFQNAFDRYLSHDSDEANTEDAENLAS